MADDYLPSTQQGAPTPELRSMVEGALNRRMTSWSKPDTGFSPAQRYRLMLDDGSRVFVKAATSDETEAWLRNEYVALRHAPTQVAPQIVAWVQSNDGHSALITEHLDGHWPASHAGVDWRPGDIDSVLEAASMLADSDGAVELPEITDDGVTWPQVLSRAGDFLSLNLCSSVWFQESFGILSEAEQQLSRGGVSLVHGDLRSDNICIVDGRAVFVDWSNAGRGSPQLDLAGLLPTLQLEADVDPYDLMPDGGAWASSGAAVAALLAMRERQAPMWLRRVWRRLAAINLSWAARSLGLAPPDGTSWREL